MRRADAGCAAPSAPRIVRGPYLQVGTQTNMLVRWRTDIAAASSVAYGTNPVALLSVLTVWLALRWIEDATRLRASVLLLAAAFVMLGARLALTER